MQTDDQIPPQTGQKSDSTSARQVNGQGEPSRQEIMARLDEIRKKPDKPAPAGDEIGKLKAEIDRLNAENERFRLFVSKAQHKGVTHIADAYALLKPGELPVQAADADIETVIERLRAERPFLFSQEQTRERPPADFSIEIGPGSSLDELEEQARNTGSPSDIQKYWEAVRKTRKTH